VSLQKKAKHEMYVLFLHPCRYQFNFIDINLRIVIFFDHLLIFQGAIGGALIC